ncbi:Jerky -like protein-like [Trichinella nelsoni]|uniref:Jerky-like protein-like n=1 Tax=Trichinella nelsoni TaxID=6336 RepID=A0A0V0RNW1_9BILA|nr:Jerky -like protein-like [Trichinella nelsoni]
MSGLSTTRKRKVLSLEQKLEVCRLVERGESLRKIAESFGVGLFTVSDIYRSRRQLTDFVSHMDTSSSCSSRKLMKKASNSALDSAIYMWFLQKRALDEPISGSILQEKLGIDNFVASSGWLRNLKSRHGIRELKIHGEKLSADSKRAEKFKCTLNDLINKERYSLDFVFNADETDLIWKCLPNTSLVSMIENNANGFKDEPFRSLFLRQCPLQLDGAAERIQYYSADANEAYSRDSAAQKKLSSFKEILITDFIKSDTK